MYRAFVAVCIVVLLVCLLPLIGVAWSSWFAERHDCVLNEAGGHPCIVDGEDWGGLIGSAFISGWLFLITLPLGAAVLVLLCLVAIIRFFLRRRT